MEETISGQIKEFGFHDLEKVTKIINYFGDKVYDGAFDMHWSHDLMDLKEFGDIIVALFHDREWSSWAGGGTGMSSHILATSGGQLWRVDRKFRDMSNPHRDCWDQCYHEILSAERDGEYVVVEMHNKKKDIVSKLSLSS